MSRNKKRGYLHVNESFFSTVAVTFVSFIRSVSQSTRACGDDPHVQDAKERMDGSTAKTTVHGRQPGGFLLQFPFEKTVLFT